MCCRRPVVAFLVLVACAGLGAAERGRADAHFDLLVDMMDRGLRLPAERGMAAFAEAGYPDGRLYLAGLRYWYARRFRILAVDPGLRARLAEDCRRLEAELAELADRLPPVVAALCSAGGGRAADLARELLQRINPDAPPPGLAAEDADRRELTALVEALLAEADRELDAVAAELADEAEDGDDEHLKERTFRRYRLANLLYDVHRVAREARGHGAVHGLEPTGGVAALEGWMAARLRRFGEDLTEWDWLYAPYYPFLRHRLAVLRGEILRLNRHPPGGKPIPAGELDADEVRQGFLEVIGTDLAPFRRQRDGAATIRAVELLQLQAWADLLQGQLALGGDAGLQEGLRLYADEFLPGHAKLTDPDRARDAALGHVHLVAARLAAAAGAPVKREEILARLAESGNFFAGNARLWLAFTPADADGVGYEQPPVAISVDLALRQAARWWRRADETDDVAEASALRLRAVAILRGGLQDLAVADEDRLADLGPGLYRYYADLLYRLGWYHQAAAVALDGLDRLVPLWRRGAFHDDGGAVTRQGRVVQELAGFLTTAGLVLRSRLDEPVAIDDLVSRAAAHLEEVDPTRAREGGQDKVIIAGHIERGEFGAALERAGAYLGKHPEERAWYLGTVALVRHRQLGELRRSEGEQDRGVREATEAFRAARDAVVAEIGPVLRRERAAPAGQERAYRQLAVWMAPTLFPGEEERVLAVLDERYWDEVPEDARLCGELLLHTVEAVHLLNRRAAAEGTLLDPAVFDGQWAAALAAAKALERVRQVHPGLPLARHRRALAGVMLACSRAARTIDEGWQAREAGYRKVDGARYGDIAHEARDRFADLMEPVLTAGSKPREIELTADACWRGGRRDRAAALYELLLEAGTGDDELKAYRRDRAGYLGAMKEILGGRSELDAFWRGDGAISSLLTRHLERDPWQMEPRRSPEGGGYGAAWGRVAELRDAVERLGSLLNRRDEMDRALDRLEHLVWFLHQEVEAKTRLVEVYRGRDGADLARGMDLAAELFAYDPASSTYRTMVVEATLRAMAKPPFPSDEELRRARTVAIQVRDEVRKNPHRRREYWLACCQVLEFSAHLDDMAKVRESLANRLRLDRSPAWDLARPDGPRDGAGRALCRLAVAPDDPEGRPDPVALDICRRFLALFELEGIDLTPPYRIETGADGAVHLLREGQTLAEAEAAWRVYLAREEAP